MMFALIHIFFQSLLFGGYIAKDRGIHVQQGCNFFQKLYGLPWSLEVQRLYNGGEIPQVSGICTGKSDAFPAFCRHIQGIVPVRVSETADIMLSNFVKSSKLLDQKMLQNASGIDRSVFCPLPAAICIVPKRIGVSAAQCLGIFKIGSFFI